MQVSQDGRALQHASEDLRGDRELVMTAVSQNGDALQHATENMRTSYEMARAS